MGYLNSGGFELSEALDGDEQGEFGFGIGAKHAADAAQLFAQGLKELREIHAVEVGSELIHVAVELGVDSGTAIIVMTAVSLPTKGDCFAAASGGEGEGAEGTTLRGFGHDLAPFLD